MSPRRFIFLTSFVMARRPAWRRPRAAASSRKLCGFRDLVRCAKISASVRGSRGASRRAIDGALYAFSAQKGQVLKIYDFFWNFSHRAGFIYLIKAKTAPVFLRQTGVSEGANDLDRPLFSFSSLFRASLDPRAGRVTSRK